MTFNDYSQDKAFKHCTEFCISNLENQREPQRLLTYTNDLHTYYSFIFNFFRPPFFTKSTVKDLYKIISVFTHVRSYLRDFDFSIDFCNSRYKVYFTVFDLDRALVLKMIKKIQLILNIEREYLVEKNSVGFGCIGIDVSKKEDGKEEIDIKVYENMLISDYQKHLDNIIDIKYVKDAIILKSLIGKRRKLYFRFEETSYPSVIYFKNEFNMDIVYHIISKYSLVGVVKTYTIEDNKKLLYFK